MRAFRRVRFSFWKEVGIIGRKWFRQAVLALAVVMAFGAAQTIPMTAAASDERYASIDDAVAVSGSTRMLVPVGRAAGIKIASDGVLVVGLVDVVCDGNSACPAKTAGLREGDLIVAVAGKKITSASDLKAAITDSREVKLTYERDGSRHVAVISPIKSDEDGGYRLGAWVRDSMAGIGTLTYYDPASSTFGALGHGINDVSTSALMPVASGTLVRSTVASVRKGEAGNPGELSGNFDLSDEFGELYSNTECGVFGRVSADELGIDMTAALPVAQPLEVKEGAATILSNVSGSTVEQYSIEIKKVSAGGDAAPRDMVIEITDPRLIEATGGIVQGMSGSPIIQNGKFVGAVTHVLINSPTRGYGIFVTRMLEESAQSAEKTAA